MRLNAIPCDRDNQYLSDDTVLSYIAGLFDGEGCVTLHGSRSLSVKMSNSHLPVLERVRAVFGGGIGVRPPLKPEHLPVYIWTTVREAPFFLYTIRPYLIVKADQADIALDYHENGGDRVTTREQLSQLKRQRY